MKCNKKALQLISLMLFISILILFSSCGLKVDAKELSAGFSRESVEEIEITEEFKSAMAHFSFELFKSSTKNDGTNNLISPLSLAIALGMVGNGAMGETLAEFESVFGMDIDSLNKNLYKYTKSLYSSSNCKLNLTNSIWFRDRENFTVRDDFLQNNANYYDAQIYAAPFDNQTIKDINNWGKYYTDGMIKETVKDIGSDTMMYLFNALVFDSKWDEKYQKSQISKGEFINYNNEKRNVEMLKSEEKWGLSGDDFIGFRKDYIGARYSLVALLPEEGLDIYDFIKDLTGEKWMEAWNNKSEGNYNIMMPEFTYEVEIDLVAPLKEMGLNSMFSEAANFKGISDTGLFCDKAQQNTFIDVSRKGTKAAAITGFRVKENAVFSYLALNRPFVYALVDNNTGLPFFIGAVTNL